MSFQFLLFSILSLDCPSLSDARDAYRLDAPSRAIEILECRRKHHPDDVESLRFLCDIYWWQNQTSEASEVADEALRLALPSDLETHFYRRRSRFRASGDYLLTDGIQGRIGHEFEGQALARYWKKNEVGFGFRRLGRAYRDLPLNYDSVWLFKHRWQPFSAMALETEVEYSKDASFSPDWLLSFVPRAYWQNYEFGLGVVAKKYPTEWTMSLRPQALGIFFDTWTAGLRLDWSLKPEQLVSAESSLEWRFHPMVSVRISGSGGKTDEGDGLTDDFYEISGRITWDALSWLRIRSLGTFYDGDLRQEWRWGGGFECFF